MGRNLASGSEAAAIPEGASAGFGEAGGPSDLPVSGVGERSEDRDKEDVPAN